MWTQKEIADACAEVEIADSDCEALLLALPARRETLVLGRAPSLPTADQQAQNAYARQLGAYEQFRLPGTSAPVPPATADQQAAGSVEALPAERLTSFAVEQRAFLDSRAKPVAAGGELSERDMLAQAIRDAVVEAGMYYAEHAFTGPLLIQACADMAVYIKHLEGQCADSRPAGGVTDPVGFGPHQFRKKPVVIGAVQWTGNNLLEVIEFTDGKRPEIVTDFAGMKWEEYSDLVARDGLKIHTLEGQMNASVGDWIIKGVQGEHYPCKPEIFTATYEPAATLAASVAPAAADEENAVLRNRIRQLEEMLMAASVEQPGAEPVAHVRDCGVLGVWAEIVSEHVANSLTEGEPLYRAAPVAAAAPEGWKLVPVEATDHMMYRGSVRPDLQGHVLRACWAAMLDAAPLFASSACPICGVSSPHQHTAEDIVSYRNRMKLAAAPVAPTKSEA